MFLFVNFENSLLKIEIFVLLVEKNVKYEVRQPPVCNLRGDITSTGRTWVIRGKGGGRNDIKGVQEFK